VRLLAGRDEATLLNGLCRGSFSRTPGDELQVRLNYRHRIIPTAWVDDTLVIKLGAGDDHNAVVRSGPVNARGDGGRSRRNYDGVGAEDPMKIRNASRRHGWWSETSARRKGLNCERWIAGWRQEGARRSDWGRREDNDIALRIPEPRQSRGWR
jgi:hypothetical protein